MSRVKILPISRALLVAVVTLAVGAILSPDLFGQSIEVIADPAPNSSLLSRLDTLPSKSARVTLLQSWYSSHGYFEAAFDTSSIDTIVVVGGPRYTFGDISIDRSDSIDSKAGALSASELFVRRAYSDSIISRAMDELLHEYESRGYPLARVSVERFRIDIEEKRVHIILRVEQSETVVLDNIRFFSEGETSQTYLMRVSGLKPGQAFSAEGIERARRSLYRTGLFRPVTTPEITRSDSGSYTLRFVLEKRSVNTFDGAIGYQPSRQVDENGFFSGTLAIGLRNIFGGGERIEGSWSKLDEATSALSLLTEVSFILGSPFGFQISYRQSDERESPLYTSYLQRELRGVATLNLGTSWRVEAGGVLSGVIPAPDTLLGPCSPRLVPRAGRFGGIVAIAYDSRDLPINPRNGVYYRSDFEVSRRSLDRPECDTTTAAVNEFSRQNISAGLSLYRNISGPLVVAMRVAGNLVAGEEIDVTELVRIGGTNSVRGYREGQFRGSQEVHGSIEGRVLLSERSHGGLFLDGGYFFRPTLSGESNTGDERVLLGYGVALQIDTPAGVARISVGLASGASPEEATVSVGLVGSF